MNPKTWNVVFGALALALGVVISYTFWSIDSQSEVERRHVIHEVKLRKTVLDPGEPIHWDYVATRNMVSECYVDRLIQPDGDSVVIWQMTQKCSFGRLGQKVSGSTLVPIPTLLPGNYQITGILYNRFHDNRLSIIRLGPLPFTVREPARRR